MAQDDCCSSPALYPRYQTVSREVQLNACLQAKTIGVKPKNTYFKTFQKSFRDSWNRASRQVVETNLQDINCSINTTCSTQLRAMQQAICVCKALPQWVHEAEKSHATHKQSRNFSPELWRTWTAAKGVFLRRSASSWGRRASMRSKPDFVV